MLLPIVLSSDAPDRRRRRRLRLLYSLRLYRPGEASRAETRTEDISCEGFFCVSDRFFSPHETLECELVIPAEEPGETTESMVLRCRAEVVRVVPHADKTGFGIACKLTDYTIGKEIEANLLMEFAT